MKTVEPMEFKTLRHKKFHDIFGVFYDNEICHSGTPNLQPMTATMEGMKKYFADQPIVFEQLEDYELVEVKVGVDTDSEMAYKNCKAEIRFSGADEVFYGKVLGIEDLVSFEGSTVEELRSAFQEAVDDYLLTHS